MSSILRAGFVIAACGLACLGVRADEAGTGVPQEWLGQVERRIADEEYSITWQASTLRDRGPSWQAPNRSQGFRTFFTGSGIVLVPRTQGAFDWEWELALEGWGRMESASDPVEPGRVRVDGATLDYERGPITERYQNDPHGLRQRLTLGVPPGTFVDTGGLSPRGEVGIDLKLGGTLSPKLSEDGRAIDFVGAGKIVVLRHAGLAVTDARGRELRSRYEGRPGPEPQNGIRIVFDDSEAVYPVTIESLAGTVAWSAESDQASAFLGYSVSTAGDVNGDGYSDVIVGAPYYDAGQTDAGRALVYHGSASGLSTTPAWTATGTQLAGQLGYSVATAGDVNGDGYSDVIVGTPRYGNGQVEEGRASVYLGSASGLSTTASWNVESNVDSAWFGAAVATAGDVNGDGYSDVIVGAMNYTNGQTQEGRAFVYHGSAAGLSTVASWGAESDQANAKFGTSVATAGDVNGDGYSDVVVGAPSYTNGQTGEGRAYVYYGSVGGLSAGPNWTAESDQAFASFGRSAATAGDVNGDGYSDVIVGAYLYTDGQSGEGAAFLYYGSVTGLATTPIWTAEGEHVDSHYGWSVATAGDVNGDGYADLIVGAPGYAGEAPNDGRGYLYLGSATGPGFLVWTADAGQTEAEYGISLGTAGDVNGDGFSDVIVGADRYTNGESLEGAAMVYLGSGDGLTFNPGWSVDSNQAFAYAGTSVATAGDVNGDGYADVIVGAPLYDSGAGAAGKAFVYAGSAAGLSPTATWALADNQPGEQFGQSVATAGDVNGDGYSDVIVGAPYYDGAVSDQGRVFVYYGSAGGLSATPAWTADGNQNEFGDSVSTAGDVNGDGYADVIVGAPLYANGQTTEGGAFVYLGSESGLAAAPAWTGESNRPFTEYGWSVSTAGDVNGDGYSDVIVGAPNLDDPESEEGGAYVYLGSASGPSPLPAWTVEGNLAGAEMGMSVSRAGDVDGDGYGDVIVGAPFYDGAFNEEGKAYLYRGSAAGLSTTPAWAVTGGQDTADLGYSVAAAGDVNGDGYADVIVGASHYNNGLPGQGRAQLYLGSAAGLAAFPVSTPSTSQQSSSFGASVSTAGDVNGDGFADVIVGAPYFDWPEVNEGRTFLYYGNDSVGIGPRPRQRRASDSGPVAWLGASESTSSFRLALGGRSPFGRGRVRLEWEVKPLGSPFNGVGTSTAVSWVDSGLAGAALNQLVSGLVAGTNYHWRVRVRYHPATTPFEPHGRWLTPPWGGWNESKLKTAGPSGAGNVGGSLRLSKGTGGNLTLTWTSSCDRTDTDYAIYEGTLGGNFTSHAAKFCSNSGSTTKTFTPGAGRKYYLLVPVNGTNEGSYGKNSAGVERPVGSGECLPRRIAPCN